MSVYEKFRVKPGPHAIRLSIKEINGRPEIVQSRRIEFQAGSAVIIQSNEGIMGLTAEDNQTEMRYSIEYVVG